MQLTPPTLQDEAREIRLCKAGHDFRLVYEAGGESCVLAALSEMVADPALPFDWFDAAVMSHQLGEHLAKELQGFCAEESRVKDLRRFAASPLRSPRDGYMSRRGTRIVPRRAGARDAPSPASGDGRRSPISHTQLRE